ncbi:hypothetical protein [Burkholderia latens]|uniref:Galactosyl transferase GMA12/MNN10 domain protein n=1 Tax=Burkholderia latens TaxID=488446 RepID=A0A6H9SPN2_9BURK|nr:hypothetical protein [Burkholderia latens]KAB0639226.1 hypothetical protein F7R21_18825 [Burkholderia latens]VWC05817.1 galactosyl transferase GMA12/MNN10 domain protein [Burkholderia latens]
MHSVLTIVSRRPVDGLVANHACYAHEQGYRHAVVDGTHVYGERQQVLHKYHAIIAQLVAMEEGALLLVLDPFSVVFGRHALPDVADGYDAIVTTQTPKSPLPAASGMIFRNVPDVRERLRTLAVELGKWAMRVPERHHDCEATLLAEHFPPLPFDRPLANGHYACAPMRERVDRICARIESFDDRSSVYASGGDQQAIYVELLHAGMIDARYVVDAMSLACSPVYATRDSRFVHFPAQHNHYRAVAMRVWDRLSHRR